jgi:hypothetical protein
VGCELDMTEWLTCVNVMVNVQLNNCQLPKRIQSCADNSVSLSVRLWSPRRSPIAVYHRSFSGDIKVSAIHSITFSESASSNLSSYSLSHPPLPATGPSELHVVIFQKKGGETTQKVRHCPL